MNLIETERLVRKLTDLLQSHASEAQARPLAQAYADECRKANHRLEQCAAMLARGDEHQALQLAEAPPPVLEQASRLTFRELDAWRAFCRKHELPVPDPLEGRFIRQLNAAYGKGLGAEHELYREYRQAVLLHRDADAVKALRSIAWRNPADANAPRELERIERKILRSRLEELDAALRAGDDARAAQIVEQTETLDFHARPDDVIWRRGQSARCRTLLRQARECREDLHWAAAAENLAEVRALGAEHELVLAPEEQRLLEDLDAWATGCHKEQVEQDRFQRALLELRQMLAQGEEQQQSGDLPDREQVRGRLDALRHKWREIQLVDRPVSGDVAARVDRLSRWYETRRHRLEVRRRNLIGAGIAGFVLLAVVGSVWLLGQRQARDVAAELKVLRDERRVAAAEKRLSALREDKSRVAAAAPVRAAMTATEEFIQVEKARAQEVTAALDRLQALAEQGFTNLPPEQTQAQFDDGQKTVESAAPDFHEELRGRFTSLLNRWDLALDARRNELAEESRKWLQQAGEVAARDLRYERGPEVVRAGLAALEPILRELQPRLAPGVARLAPPAEVQAGFRELQQRVQACSGELTKWDQVQAAWKQPASLGDYLEALRLFQRSEFAAPAEARAAGDLLGLNVTEAGLRAALLLPNQAEAWAAFQADPALRLQPDEVVPAERTVFRELRDDEHTHNVRAFRRILTSAPANDPGRVRMVYLRGEWENTKSAVKRGLVYDPADSPNELTFRLQEFISNVQFEELGRIAEAGVFELAGLKQLFDANGTNYGAAGLSILDHLNRDQKASPLFRAWTAWRLHELLDLRPVLWSAPWTPALAQDRKRLRELGVEALRSGDWLVPARQREWTEKLEEHFKRARAVAYVTQARFLNSLAQRTGEAGFVVRGHVSAAGQPVLAGTATPNLELWGWANPAGPALLFRWRATENGFTAVNAPQPFSPLLEFRGDRRQLPAQARATLGPRAAEAGDYLPPLFALADE